MIPNITPLKKKVLLYNFADDERTRKIRRFFTRHKVQIITVQSPEFAQPLGYLCELPGFNKLPAINLGKNFTDEMLVMNGLPEQLVDEFLQFFRDNSIKPVELKAIVTLVNQHWSSIELYKALIEEKNSLKS